MSDDTMEPENTVTEIVVCLGSSCYARGNSINLATLQRFLERQGQDGPVKLAGCLCQDACKLGPNMKVAGEAHHAVTAAHLRDILHRLTNDSRGSNGNV